MIYDCFSFFNELDLLEIRLNTLNEVVDRFVISESRYTHTGQPKPLYYKENESRFAKFKDKVIHVVSPDPADPAKAGLDTSYSWLCENRQRNATIQAIESKLEDDDVLIVSDIDEIPNPATVVRAIKLNRPTRLRQKLYYYYLNYRCCTTPYWTTGSVVLHYRDFRNPATYKMTIDGMAFNKIENSRPSATKVRALRNIKMLRDGGWHFSYIGGAEKVLAKISSIVEGRGATLRDKASIHKCILSGNDIYDRGEWFFAEKPDSTFPIKSKDFPFLFFPADNAYLRSVRFKRLLAYLKWLIRPIAWKLIPHGLASQLSKRFSRI